MVRALFLAACAALLIHGAWLASVTTWPGSPDSVLNLLTARNLAEGQGFHSPCIMMFWDRQAFPNPESNRPPGVPFLVALFFRIFGVSLAVPVALNVAMVLAVALVLRQAVASRTGHAWAGELAAAVWLLSGRFELVSIWNNNGLVLCTASLLAIGEAARTGRLPAGAVAPAAALVTAIGFFFKPTFIVAAVPYSAMLVGPRRALVYLGALALFSSPYWVRNVALFGSPLYHPARGGRLAITYKIFPADPNCIYTVRYDAPVTLSEVIEKIGVGGMVRRHLVVLRELLVDLAWLNPAWTLAFLWLFRIRGVGLPLVLAAGPIFESLYWHHEQRYAWPVFPVAIFATLAAAAGRDDWTPGRRRLATGLVLLALAFGGLRMAKIGRIWAREAQTPPPAGWPAAVQRLPADAVVLARHPWDVAWWGRRNTVLTPHGGRPELEKVVGQCGITHALDPDAQLTSRWPPEGRTLVEEGPAFRLWRLVRSSPGTGP